MELNVDGIFFDVGQLGPGFVILGNASDHPPAEGEIMVSIDGHVRRWRVQLPDGVSANKVRTRIADLP